MNIVLALKDYEKHLSPEGAAVQRGLERHGYRLVGYGYEDGCTLVPRLIDRYRPEIVVVQDVRDWARDKEGCFAKEAHFDGIDWLAQSGAYVAMVLKDAWGDVGYQREMAERMGAKALITYGTMPVLEWAAGDWVRGFHHVPIYHTVLTNGWTNAKRFRGIVTGARNKNMYPLREYAYENATTLGLVTEPHPGYGNYGWDAMYTHRVALYRAHVATSNKYGYLMAKVIESCAAGTYPITDTERSQIPESIRPWVIHCPTMDALGGLIDHAERSWSPDVAREMSQAAHAAHNLDASGARLAAELGKKVVLP